MYTALFGAGAAARPRRWPPPSCTAGAACWRPTGTIQVGTARRAGGLPDPPVRAADGALERPGQRHDRARLLRPDLRGARPQADGRARSPTRSTSEPGPAKVEFEHVDFSYPRAEDVSLASLESGGGPRPGAVAAGAARRQLRRPSRASWSRWSGRRAPARRRSATSCRGSTTSAAARCGSTTSTSATRRSSRCAARSAW